MFVTLRGEPYLLWRAVDEQCAELDVLVQKRREVKAAARVNKRAKNSHLIRITTPSEQRKSTLVQLTEPGIGVVLAASLHHHRFPSNFVSRIA
ncbi:hypothetical protein P3T22_002636 [Paraburkholderia sp. GAS348]